MGSCPGGAFRLRTGAVGGGRMILSFGLMTVCGDAAGRGRETGAGLVCEIGAGHGREIGAGAAQDRLCQVRR